VSTVPTSTTEPLLPTTEPSSPDPSTPDLTEPIPSPTDEP
jgi:hypothetical protein